MITYVRSSLFSSPAKVLVNTVNTVGVMGKGIAKELKAIFPEMYDDFRARCERGELTVGALHLFMTPNKWVLARLSSPPPQKTFADVSVRLSRQGPNRRQPDSQRRSRPSLAPAILPS